MIAVTFETRDACANIRDPGSRARYSLMAFSIRNAVQLCQMVRRV